MTTEEKARAYDEALKKAQCWLNDPQTIQDCNYTIEDAIQNIFPELAESEDEKIRKELLKEIEFITPRDGETDGEGLILPSYHARIDRYKSYLEKQKENPKSADSIPSDCTSDAKYEGRWHNVKDSLPDSTREVLCKDAIGNYFIGRYYSKGVWEVSMYDDCDKSNEDNPPVVKWCEIPSEKQKEQKPEHFELKAGKWYICHRAFCCRADHLTVKEGERFMCEKDGIVKGFVIKEPEKYFKECSAPAPMEDEQKPVDYNEYKMLIDGAREHGRIEGRKEVIDHPEEYGLTWQKPVQSEVEREYVRTLKSLISDFLRGKEDVDREYYQQIFDWLDGRHLEQKPVDFPTTDEEVNEFLETHSKVEVPEKYKTPDFVFSKQEYESYPIISKDTTSVKPAEWSEEDVDMLNCCISSIEEAKENRYAYKETDGDTSYDHDISWLKSLRPVSKESLQPHWKPSEEQMESLAYAIQVLNSNPHPKSAKAYQDLQTLYKNIKYGN